MAASTSYDSDHVGVRILDAALQLLRSGGPRAVTMQFVTEATERLAPQSVIDPQASREQRLRWAISQSIDVVVNGIGPVALRLC